ncbi:NAD(P)H-dependent oxidoreductase (plasmid) [Agrobacterium tumefaciens]|uniref:NADPH-dependent FMN reductase n=1 Tax=Agrobacterium tumefaciens TaxID=358 RepID=UPI0021D1F08F|nr:NAD(P)H-dependent oxidoreductase [Agrobacterium tumefaciens]NTZ64232.1 NAD(P)H-dependent oxidoreductase [Agrobacterium tumefaciens]UXT00178.1 NAD(P)H-dependent oxidoreductase [Agrobacterium tumefaciens]UXT00350.1 NAD(P)H-dependent oxidoreductase [Agrobacterium tumefaciens]UXT52878.1 NAD(P)H-dependent oxidoreductase [Agrobacterium tumefaciens]UXT68939.1 NAD(P)H-dependent oxidoreductase [Agrobacterium tumefaciens]
MTQPKILTLAASTRSQSFNRKLAHLVTKRIEARGGLVEAIDLADYALPIYDGDLEARDGVPKAAHQLHEKFRSHGGIFIASPELNANVSPLLLNVLAWVSRVGEHGGIGAAFGKPVFALGSASPGGFGGYRGLMSLRNTLELQLGARVLPTMVSVGTAHEAFDELGDLKSAFPKQMLDRLVPELVSAASN